MTILFRTAGEIAASPRAPVRMACAALQLAQGRACLVSGPQGSGKSTLTLQAALEIAAGLPVFGALAADTMPVTFFDFEIGPLATEERLHAVAEGIGVRLADLGTRFRYASFPPASFETEAGTRELFAAVREGLLVVDTLGAASGSLDQNDARIAVPLLAASAWSARTGGCSIFLAHPGHDGTRVRGSSAIRDAAGAEWNLRGSGEGQRTLVCSKAHPLALSRASKIVLTREIVSATAYRLVAARTDSPLIGSSTEGPPAGSFAPVTLDEYSRVVLATAAAHPAGLTRDALAGKVRGRSKSAALATIDLLVRESFLRPGTKHGRGTILHAVNRSHDGTMEAAE